MNKEKPSLGRGLDSLLGDKPKSTEGGMTEIAIEDLVPGQYQPRQKMHRSTLEELSASIKQQGVIQPLIVRKRASGRYEIVVGERRWRAAQMVGLKTVPVIVKDLNNRDTAKISLIENLQREDLNIMDQARGLQRLQTEFNLTQEELGDAIGKSRTSVTNTLRLIKLNKEVQTMLEEGSIEMGHARALVSLKEELQVEVAKEVVNKGLSVRQVENLVAHKKSNRQSTKRPTNKDPNTLILEKELSEILGTKIEIKHNKNNQGRLVVSFNSLESLQGIIEKLKK